MLKITTVDTPTEFRIILVGKLVGPWIAETQRAWNQFRQQPGNRIPVVDLNDVTTIDGSANNLLAAMLQHGAELVAGGLVNRSLIRDLKEGKTRISVRALRPNPEGFCPAADLESKREALRLAASFGSATSPHSPSKFDPKPDLRRTLA